MQWVGNNLIDDKNKFLVGYNEGGDWYDYASITVYDNNNNDITDDDLTDWEFAEFPQLDAVRNCQKDEILIINRELKVAGKVVLICSNNGHYNANYWTEKME